MEKYITQVDFKKGKAGICCTIEPFIGYKVAILNDTEWAILKVEIPDGSLIVRPYMVYDGIRFTSDKLRTDKLIVTNIYDFESNKEITVSCKCHSPFYPDFKYERGVTYTPDYLSPDTDSCNERGLHFFGNMSEARQYCMRLKERHLFKDLSFLMTLRMNP
jgi:hypothetical protein